MSGKNQKGKPCETDLPLLKKNNYFTASFKAFPATNFGTLLAGISISSPVCGLRPLRAFLSATLFVGGI